MLSNRNSKSVSPGGDGCDEKGNEVSSNTTCREMRTLLDCKSRQQYGNGLRLSQRQYMMEILDRAGMSDCKPCATPVDTNPKLPVDGGVPVADPSDFHGLAGALQYLTFTRQDISYAIQHICLHMHDPREPHLAALKRILRYV